MYVATNWVGVKLNCLSKVLTWRGAARSLGCGSNATLALLQWAHDSVDDFELAKMTARDSNDSENQISIWLGNHTFYYSEDGPAAKRWAEYMHSMCESFRRQSVE